MGCAAPFGASESAGRRRVMMIDAVFAVQVCALVYAVTRADDRRGRDPQALETPAPMTMTAHLAARHRVEAARLFRRACHRGTRTAYWLY
jgi:hypothetical protein